MVSLQRRFYSKKVPHNSKEFLEHWFCHSFDWAVSLYFEKVFNNSSHVLGKDETVIFQLDKGAGTAEVSLPWCLKPEDLPKSIPADAIFWKYAYRYKIRVRSNYHEGKNIKPFPEEEAVLIQGSAIYKYSPTDSAPGNCTVQQRDLPSYVTSATSFQVKLRDQGLSLHSVLISVLNDHLLASLLPMPIIHHDYDALSTKPCYNYQYHFARDPMRALSKEARGIPELFIKKFFRNDLLPSYFRRKPRGIQNNPTGMFQRREGEGFVWSWSVVFPYKTLARSVVLLYNSIEKERPKLRSPDGLKRLDLPESFWTLGVYVIISVSQVTACPTLPKLLTDAAIDEWKAKMKAYKNGPPKTIQSLNFEAAYNMWAHVQHVYRSIIRMHVQIDLQWHLAFCDLKRITFAEIRSLVDRFARMCACDQNTGPCGCANTEVDWDTMNVHLYQGPHDPNWVMGSSMLHLTDPVKFDKGYRYQLCLEDDEGLRKFQNAVKWHSMIVRIQKVNAPYDMAFRMIQSWPHSYEFRM